MEDRERLLDKFVRFCEIQSPSRRERPMADAVIAELRAMRLEEVEEDDTGPETGSNAGNVNAPAWALNLRANPDAEVEVGADKRQVRGRVAEGPEREDLWRRMNEQYAGFDDYKGRTTRDIAVFVLEPR